MHCISFNLPLILVCLMLSVVASHLQTFCNSISDLESLATSDLIFYRQLQSLRSNFSRIAAVQQKLEQSKKAKNSFPPKFRHFIDDFESSTGYTYTNLKHPTKVLANNPIAVYRMIRRIVSVTPEIVKLGKYGFAISVEKHQHHFDGRWPDQTDVNEAIDAILQIHHVYNLNITEFADGNMFGIPTGIKLEAFHCFEIGMHAKKSKFYTLAFEWLERALQKLLTVLDDTVQESEVVEALENVIKEHDEEFDNVDNWQPFFYTKKIQSDASRKERRIKRRDSLYATFKGRREFKYNDINYWALCSGESLQSEQVKKDLFCWLETKISKMLSIGPLKMELLSRNPDVVQIYDLVGDEEMEKMQKGVVEGTNDNFEVVEDDDSSVTTSTTNFKIEFGLIDNRAMDRGNKVTMKEELSVISKIKLLSGFELPKNNSAEQFDVKSYSFAGAHHSSSDDTIMYESEYAPGNHGNQFATLMIWLSDVQLGGYTVFPSLLVAGRPVKGSALLYYGTYRDGSRDYLTSSLSCPVVLGQKWSATAKISYDDQFLRHKCGVSSKERFHVSVNGIYHTASTFNSKTDMMVEQEINWLHMKQLSHGSVPGVKRLALEEQNIYNFIENLYEMAPHDMSISASFKAEMFWLESYIKDFEDTTGKLAELNQDKEDVANQVAHNLLASYRMTWRFGTYLKKMMWWNQPINSSNRIFSEIALYLQRSFGVTSWPDNAFLEDSITGILVIQHIHDLQAMDIASGNVNGVQTSIYLNAIHSYEIGKFAMASEYYSLGIEWLELAASKVADGKDISIHNDTVRIELRKSIKTHNHAFVNSAGWEPLFYTRPVFLLNDKNRTRRKVKQYNTFKLRDDPDLSEINYWGVCSGKPHQTEDQKSKLFCWYEKAMHPYLLINPFKAEIHSLIPKLEIVQYYDVLSSRTIDQLKASASPDLKKSPIQSFYNDGFYMNSNWRLSVQSSIHEDSKGAKKISNAIQLITGLSDMGQQDSLEIASYNPGSHYNVHLDSVSFINDAIDDIFMRFNLPPYQYNRIGHGEGLVVPSIGSVLFSLSDVENGGEAAFAQAGVRIKPVKGSAIFWYNLLSSGDLNDYSWHGICPVIYGEYWVATKWINYEEQMSKSRCGLRSREPYEILVNGRSKYSLQPA